MEAEAGRRRYGLEVRELFLDSRFLGQLGTRAVRVTNVREEEGRKQTVKCTRVCMRMCMSACFGGSPVFHSWSSVRLWPGLPLHYTSV